MRWALAVALVVADGCTAVPPNAVTIAGPAVRPRLASVEITPRVADSPSSEPAADPAVADGLSGTWSGSHIVATRVAGGGAPATVGFFAELVIERERVRGSVIEPNLFDDDTGGELHSTVVGAIDTDGVVRFTKRYDAAAGIATVVEYVGRLDLAAARIEGTWSTAHDSGRFVMRRDRPLPQVAQRGPTR